MLGAIVGDIIGSRFEFDNCLTTSFELFTDQCSFTDDTICTVAVADAILKKVSFRSSLLKWCREYPFPMGSYGGSFAVWLRSPNPQPYNSYGNGSAMRVSPCGSAELRERAILLAQKSAECTHDHPEGIKGATSIAECIWLANDGASKQEIRSLISQKYGYNIETNCDQIRRTNSFNETCQVTIPQALVAFFESDSFEDAIRLSVSIGGDSDTIAAITGSLAEAFYGIPEEIKDRAIKFLPQEMKEVINEFYKLRTYGKI
jgi:ADP-ribosyl-[dinitrogen reductase] hydrolase